MKTIFAVAALAAAWSGAPAAAQTLATSASRHVAVHDLDLSRRTDVDRLDRRIAAAARRVCADPSSSLYGSYAASRDCTRATRRATVGQRDAAISAARGVALAGR